MLFEEINSQNVFLLTDEILKEQLRLYALPDAIKETNNFNILLVINEEKEYAKLLVLAEGLCFELERVDTKFEYLNKDQISGYIDNEEVSCPVLLNVGFNYNKEKKTYDYLLTLYHINQEYDTHYIDSYECLMEDNKNGYEWRKLLLREVKFNNCIIKTKSYTTTIEPKDEFLNNEEILKLVLEKNNKFKGFTSK